MKPSQNAGTRIGKRATATTKTGVRQAAKRSAIVDKKVFEEEFVLNDVDQEIDSDDLDNEIDDEEEVEVVDHDSVASDEDLSGQCADAGVGSESEPTHLEDHGDSDRWMADGNSDAAFHPAHLERFPLVSELPPQARPIVRFAIDSNYQVRSLDLIDDRHFAIRKMLAAAVAVHLKQHDITLSAAGDWYQIPAIGSEDELLKLAATVSGDESRIEVLVELRCAVRKTQKSLQALQNKLKTLKKKSGSESTVQEQERVQEQLKAERSALQKDLEEQLSGFTPEFQAFHSRLEDFGARLKEMGIVLPNREVVTVAVLMISARKDKRATLAAALRTVNARPSSLAGEPWDESDWAGFEESQRKAKYRKRSR